jgi:hypothetical protein
MRQTEPPSTGHFREPIIGLDSLTTLKLGVELIRVMDVGRDV